MSVYLGDIVIYGPSLEDHNKRLEEMLQKLRENNLKLQPEFLCKETIHMGHVISENGIFLDPSKLTAIKEFTKECQRHTILHRSGRIL